MGQAGRLIFRILLLASVAAITYLHFTTSADEHHLYSIYAELHYVPLLGAALLFGVRGTLCTFLLVSLFYFSFLSANLGGTLILLMDNFADLVSPGAIAIVVGFLCGPGKEIQKRA